MTTTEESDLFAEDILTAIFYKVGVQIRLIDNEHLATIFNDVAQKYGGIFGQFKMHRKYHYSKVLSNTLQTLDLGGTIVRDNAALKYFKPSKHTAGPYGKSKFENLDSQQQDVVNELADKIRDNFNGE